MKIRYSYSCPVCGAGIVPIQSRHRICKCGVAYQMDVDCFVHYYFDNKEVRSYKDEEDVITCDDVRKRLGLEPGV